MTKNAYGTMSRTILWSPVGGRKRHIGAPTPSHFALVLENAGIYLPAVVDQKDRDLFTGMQALDEVIHMGEGYKSPFLQIIEAIDRFGEIELIVRS